MIFSQMIGMKIIFRDPFYWNGLTELRAGISNHIIDFMLDVISHPWPNFKVVNQDKHDDYIPLFYLHVIAYISIPESWYWLS